MFRLSVFTLVVGLLLPAHAVADAPGPYLQMAGQETRYAPLGFTPRLSLTGRVEGYSGFAVDRDQTQYAYETAFNTQFRIGLLRDDRFGFIRLLTEYEHDFLTGAVVGGGQLEGEFVPDSSGVDTEALRKLYVQLSFGPIATLAVGFMTSHWGLGLIANDGAHGFAPGSADFTDPRDGDRVLRGLFASGPHTSERITLFTAFDIVQGDDVLFPGDSAIQAIGGIRVGEVRPEFGDATPYEAGIYGVWRKQTATDDKVTEVGVVDLYARYLHKWPGMSLDVAFEGALIMGTSELAPNPEHIEHDVLQLGAKLRVAFDAGIAGAVLDVVYASGDQNLDDAAQNGFKADINSDVGLILFSQVLAAQTARSVITAANPDLIGVPNEDLDRLATRGNVTNTISIFPRGWVRPVDGLEIYGGVLMALSEVDYVDAFNARIAGGGGRNPTNRSPGAYYGTELDLGVRFHGLLFGTEVSLGLEGGVLFPGSALLGTSDDPLFGGRAFARYRF